MDKEGNRIFKLLMEIEDENAVIPVEHRDQVQAFYILFKSYVESKDDIINQQAETIESLKCCGNCGHPERSGDYCPYANTNVFKHHYCSNWMIYKPLNSVERNKTN